MVRGAPVRVGIAAGVAAVGEVVAAGVVPVVVGVEDCPPPLLQADRVKTSARKVGQTRKVARRRACGILISFPPAPVAERRSTP
jgi:hypothetical protein